MTAIVENRALIVVVEGMEPSVIIWYLLLCHIYKPQCIIAAHSVDICLLDGG